MTIIQFPKTNPRTIENYVNAICRFLEKPQQPLTEFSPEQQKEIAEIYNDFQKRVKRLKEI